jgi:hypothetical protein
MDRLERLANPTLNDAASERPRDFTLRRGAQIYRIRADGRSEAELLRELRTIARPTDRRRAA